MKKIKESDIKKDDLLYAVMKLSTKIEYVNPITNKMVYEKLLGCAGFIPVYSTIEEAKKHSENGKYQILAITTKN